MVFTPQQTAPLFLLYCKPSAQIQRSWVFRYSDVLKGGVEVFSSVVFTVVKTHSLSWR